MLGLVEYAERDWPNLPERSKAAGHMHKQILIIVVCLVIWTIIEGEKQEPYATNLPFFGSLIMTPNWPNRKLIRLCYCRLMRAARVLCIIENLWHVTFTCKICRIRSVGFYKRPSNEECEKLQNLMVPLTAANAGELVTWIIAPAFRSTIMHFVLASSEPVVLSCIQFALAWR